MKAGAMLDDGVINVFYAFIFVKSVEDGWCKAKDKVGMKALQSISDSSPPTPCLIVPITQIKSIVRSFKVVLFGSGSYFIDSLSKAF